MSCDPPYEELRDRAIQRKYGEGSYPDTVKLFPESAMIAVLVFWSKEFEEAWNRPDMKTSFGVGAMLVIPGLNVIGFSAAGPVAGSIAAGIQSSIGVIEAGSLFAWCQSAAMGGYAAARLATAGGTGAGAAVASGVVSSLAKPDVWKKFNEVVRKN
ncbi:hypothetical protein BDN72DRAFT_962022 [Pluteus cervinus]|uniref:Uncharacterized protein n=1 Tax=Pluteus cervinus TaxID=181527 RepID=A0ACD3AJM2_9AGAR|nr:hypothetical protein BDN72DRAFT_962022 [Pluteus cervinus]